jgi:hypothetical protein
MNHQPCSFGLSATSQQYFSQNKPATSNQPAVLFSQNKPASAISHQPTEQAACCQIQLVESIFVSVSGVCTTYVIVTMFEGYWLPNGSKVKYCQQG